MGVFGDRLINMQLDRAILKHQYNIYIFILSYLLGITVLFGFSVAVYMPLLPKSLTPK
jgi:pilus assembly protein TadC